MGWVFAIFCDSSGEDAVGETVGMCCCNAVAKCCGDSCGRSGVVGCITGNKPRDALGGRCDGENITVGRCAPLGLTLSLTGTLFLIGFVLVPAPPAEGAAVVGGGVGR